MLGIKYISFVILFKVFTGTLSFKIENEENLMGNGLIKSLADFSVSDDLLDVNDIYTDKSSQDSINKFGNKFMSIPVFIETSKGNTTDELIEYVDHIKKRGVKSLKNMVMQILKTRKVEKNIITNSTKEIIVKGDVEKKLTRKMNPVAINYVTKIQNYFNYIMQLQIQYSIDNEYMFLDILETASRLLNHEQRNLLNDTALEVNSSNNLLLNETIHKETINFKKEEMRYICNHYRICRPYSAFAVYFERFINEILSLTDIEIKQVFEAVASLVIGDEDYQELVRDNLRTSRTVERYFENLVDVKEFLRLVKHILNQRYKIIQCRSTEFKVRIQAFRHLLDILDNAFNCKHDDDFFIDFNNSVEAIRNFTALNSNFYMQISISNFVNYIFKSINYSDNPMRRLLIEAVVRGDVELKKFYYILFVDGAKGVYFSEIDSEISI